MILLIVSVLSFNWLAFRPNRVEGRQQTAHVWAFTMAFQLLFDLLFDFKFKGYWYFEKNSVDWTAFLARTLLIPPVNLLFLGFFPSERRFLAKAGYLAAWTAAILGYELLTMLPAPWGYFHYGWRNIGYSAVVDPILFFMLLFYYRCFIQSR
ncbi:hypothetical protein SAMN02799624_00610 [Paenibacillus sp. UNC496MF]|uniref:hypothetical protein n=1 Tax=Paenibacillus sp. UNC496MF TaxID=1502753 RepID=UPI0008EDCD02|nr:hypothetical protein [Paenibacillus sp. UNC496MF]SFI36430.1 hypothetical protein SAMN02799624_00610 [Paenibacillus sp. UNC496MF]